MRATCVFTVASPTTSSAAGAQRGGRKLDREPASLYLAYVGTYVVFATVLFVGALATRETVEAAFVLFALGFLALIVGQALLGVGLRRGGLAGSGWVAPLAGVGAAVLAITTGADPYHDIGLVLFFGSWVALGGAVLGRYSGRPAVSSEASAWS